MGDQEGTRGEGGAGQRAGAQTCRRKGKGSEAEGRAHPRGPLARDSDSHTVPSCEWIRSPCMKQVKASYSG